MSVAVPPAPPPPVFTRGHHRGRLRWGALVGIFGGVLAVALGATALFVTAAAPSAPKPKCATKDPCGKPPVEPAPHHPLAPALVSGKLLKSSRFGYELEYSGGDWALHKRTGTFTELVSQHADAIVTVQGSPSRSASLKELMDGRASDLENSILGLTKDADPADQILGPGVGYRDGVGSVYTGTIDTPQGPSLPVDVVIMAATDGQSSVVVTVIAAQSDRDVAYGQADSLMNTFRFPSEVAS